MPWAAMRDTYATDIYCGTTRELQEQENYFSLSLHQPHCFYLQTFHGSFNTLNDNVLVETLGPGIHVDVSLLTKTLPHIVSDKVDPLIATALPASKHRHTPCRRTP